jgi:hypothetical protein
VPGRRRACEAHLHGSADADPSAAGDGATWEGAHSPPLFDLEMTAFVYAALDAGSDELSDEAMQKVSPLLDEALFGMRDPAARS